MSVSASWHKPDVVTQFLEPSSPVVRTRAGLNANQASRTLDEKRRQLAAAKLSAHENTTVLIDTKI